LAKPGARRAALAACAVTRVEADAGPKVGSCGACAAARGGGASQRWRPLKAAGPPRPVPPVRRAATPTAPASRPHPNRRSAWRGLPPQACSALCAGKARRQAPCLCAAAKRNSVIGCKLMG
jgi:hypothetical protein